MTDNTSIDALLDANLDDLADLPEFGVYPAGHHKVTISFEKKEVNKKPCIEASFKLIETVEQADPTAAPASAGQSGSVLYMLDNEFGQGALKRTLLPIGAALGLSSIRDILDAAKNLEVDIITSVRMNKDKTQSYCDIKKLIM